MPNFNDTAFIPLKHSDSVAIVDVTDFLFLNQWEWKMSGKGYAVRQITMNGVDYQRFMHRIIADAPDAIQVDHINRNKLDNRRCNLRLATSRQNSLNRGPNERRARDVKFKGVYSNPHCATFYAKIRINDKSIYLGSFRTQEEAARAYDVAARLYHGDFAFQNLQG